MRKLVMLSLLAFLAAPLIVLAQAAATVNPDDLGQIATFLLNAIRGGDKQLAVLAGLVLAVRLVRWLGTKVPALEAFLLSDPGGVILTVATVVPLTLLTARAAGQPLTWQLAWAGVSGAVSGFVLLRKLLRPLVAKIPKVGSILVSLIDLVTSAPSLAPAKVASGP